MIRRPIHIII